MTKKRISIPVLIASILLSCIVTFQVTAIVFSGIYKNAKNVGHGSQSQTETDDDFISRATSRLSELDSTFRNLYIGDIDDETLIDWILLGYIYGTGDDYAEYYNEEDYRTLLEDLSGEGEGIGISVIYNSEYSCIEILNVFPDSPAEQAGLRVGDLILYVGEERETVSSMGYYVAISKLRGRAGTEAVFTVGRGGDPDALEDFRIIRGEYTEVNVFSHVYAEDTSIGIVKITGFDSQVPGQFKAAVKELLDSGCDKLIFDMRSNPGGELNSIIDTLDYLLPKGPIIRIYDRNGEQVDQYDSDAAQLDVPMVVLVNHSTASAAELFTAALRDYGKATVVGTTTYGKGCMQTTVDLPSGGAVSVTYRMFKPPFSESYHGIGIIPDIEVELDEALAEKNIYKITDEEDNQLRAAAAAFKKD